MKTILFIAAVFLLASLGSAWAQLDPGPNGLGVYFDQEASSVVQNSDGSSSVSAYLVLTNPTEMGALSFWTCTVRPEDQGSGAVFIWGEPRMGINTNYPMPGQQSFTFFVSNESPGIPSLEPVLVLADLTIDLGGYSQPVGLHLENNSVYSLTEFTGWFEDNLVALNPSSGAFDLPVAVINGEAPVATDHRSWDYLKALYHD